MIVLIRATIYQRLLLLRLVGVVSQDCLYCLTCRKCLKVFENGRVAAMENSNTFVRDLCTRTKIFYLIDKYCYHKYVIFVKVVNLH